MEDAIYIAGACSCISGGTILCGKSKSHGSGGVAFGCELGDSDGCSRSTLFRVKNRYRVPVQRTRRLVVCQ